MQLHLDDVVGAGGGDARPVRMELDRVHKPVEPTQTPIVNSLTADGIRDLGKQRLDFGGDQDLRRGGGGRNSHVI